MKRTAGFPTQHCDKKITEKFKALLMKLVQTSQTHCLSIERTFSRIFQQWAELRTHSEISNLIERYYADKILHQQNCPFLMFLGSILREVQNVNKKFECENDDPIKLLYDIV
jgi:hypothetical protein